MSLNLNFLAIEIDLDAKVVVNWVQGLICTITTHSSLVTDCREADGQVFREANKCTNGLTRIGVGLYSRICDF